MTTMALRQWFRDEIVLALPAIPFKETLNVLPDLNTTPRLQIWTTIEFENAGSSRISLGDTQAIFRELGQVNLIVVGLSGKGDAVVGQAGEDLRNYFRERRGSVTIPGALAAYYELGEPSPPDTAPNEDGNWFLCVVSCPYKLDVFRDI